MDIFDFLGWNLLLVGAGFIGVLVYLVILFRRRQRAQAVSDEKSRKK